MKFSKKIPKLQYVVERCAIDKEGIRLLTVECLGPKLQYLFKVKNSQGREVPGNSTTSEIP